MRKDWAETREMGRNAFIWKKGVLEWGILTAILTSSIMLFIFPPEPWWKLPLIALFVFPFAGYFWGLSVWKVSEKKFHADQEANDS